MKKIAVLFLALVLIVMSGCGASSNAGTSAKTVDLSAVMTEIRSAVELPEMMDLTENDLMDYFGIDASTVADFATCINANGYEKDEIVLLHAKDEAAVPALKDALQNTLEYAAQEMQNYIPEQYTMIQNSSVQSEGLYVWMFISNDNDAMNSIMQKALAA